MCCATRAATNWPTMGETPDRSNTILATSRLLRRFATRRSRRIGSRISGEIEKTHQRMRTAGPLPATAKDPRGDPRIIWVPYSRSRPTENTTESQMSFALSLPCSWQYLRRTGKRCPRILSYACLYCRPGPFRLRNIVHKRKLKLSWTVTAVRLVLLVIYNVFTGHG